VRAARYDRFGPPEVVEVREVPAPVPARGEIRVRVRAAALNPKDVLTRSGRFRLLSGRRFPRGVGLDLAGEVDALGPGADGFAPGDPVLGMLPGWMGGTCAELACVPAASIARAPPGIGFPGAAALPLAGLTALQALRDLGRLGPGDRACVNGAAGGVGSLAVQIARNLGAKVTAVARASNRSFCEDLGADEVVAHDESDVFAGGRRFDVFFDAFGNRSYPQARRSLTPRGAYVTTVPRGTLLLDAVLTTFGPRRARLVAVRADGRDLALLAGWAEGGLLRPVLDLVLPLDRIVEAMRRVETRRARGKVVLVP
jgi:NADPH:quinone reductase-like Zn-dependent oxidoreductase